MPPFLWESVMAIRAMISFDVIKGERLYHVLIPNGSPFQEAKDVLNEIIESLSAQEKADQEAREAQPQPESEVQPEVVVES